MTIPIALLYRGLADDLCQVALASACLSPLFNVRNQRLLMTDFEVTFDGRLWVTPEASTVNFPMGKLSEAVTLRGD